MACKHLLVTIAALTGATASAAEILTLEQALALALENNHSL